MKNYENTALLYHTRRFDAKRREAAIARREAAERKARLTPIQQIAAASKR